MALSDEAREACKTIANALCEGNTDAWRQTSQITEPEALLCILLHALPEKAREDIIFDMFRGALDKATGR